MVYKFAQKVDRSSRDAVVTICIETGLIIATLQTMPAFGKAPSRQEHPRTCKKEVFIIIIVFFLMIS